MTVLTSRMAAALDALVTVMTATLGSAPDTAVIDGPFNRANDEVGDAAKRLFIGTNDPYGQGESIAVDGDQNFRTVGARWRDETFVVQCLAEGWNGDNDIKAARDAAVSLLAAVETQLRPTADNPDAYNLGGSVLWAGIGAESITQEHNDKGAYVRVDFAIACRANLIAN